MGTFPFPLFPAFPSFTWTIPIPRHFAPQSKPGQCIGFFFTLELPNAAKGVLLCVRPLNMGIQNLCVPLNPYYPRSPILRLRPSPSAPLPIASRNC